MKKKIITIFQSTEIDFYFITIASSKGWADYFMNLDLDELDKAGLTECYNRCLYILSNIPKRALPNKLAKFLA